MYAAKTNGRNAWVDIFAEQAEVVPGLSERLIRDPDSLRAEGKIRCPSSFSTNKDWSFENLSL